MMQKLSHVAVFLGLFAAGVTDPILWAADHAQSSTPRETVHGLNPEHTADEWYQRGQVAEKTGDREQALSSYQKALELDPTNVTYLITLANAYQRAAKYAEGHTLLEAAREQAIAPEFQHEVAIALANLHLAWGHQLITECLHRQALSHFEAVAISEQEYRPQNAVSALRTLGEVYFHTSQYEQAIQSYEQALTILKESEDPRLEGRIMSKLGEAYEALYQFDRAKDVLAQALSLQRRLHDRAGEGETLDIMGTLSQSLNDYDTAEQYFDQALVIRREVQDRKGEGKTLENLGHLARARSRYDHAIEDFTQALAIQREIGDCLGEAASLNGLAGTLLYKSEYKQAQAYYEHVLTIVRKAGDRKRESIALVGLGLLAYEQSQYETALQRYNQALEIAGEIKDRGSEGIILNQIGQVYLVQGQPDKASEYFSQSLAIAREVEYRPSEAYALSGLGAVSLARGRPKEAIASFEQALGIVRALKNRAEEGTLLSNLSDAYSSLGQYEKTLAYCRQAITIAKEVHNPSGEASSLNNLGTGHYALGQYDEAVDAFQQALALFEQLGNGRGEVTALSNLGVVASERNQHQAAIQSFQKALEKKKILGLPIGIELNNIGQAYLALSQFDAARASLKQALQAAQQSQLRPLEGMVINNLGTVSYLRGQYAEAITYVEHARKIAQEVENPQQEALTLTNLCSAHGALSQHTKATDACEAAFSIQKRIQNPAGRAGVLVELGKTYNKLSQYDKAIEYLNQARAIEQQLGPHAGSSMNALADVYVHLGQDSQAFELFTQALELTRAAGNRMGEGRVLNNLCLTHRELRQYDQAQKFCEQAVEVAREVKDPEGEAIALGNLGGVFFFRGELKRALDYLKQSLALNQTAGHRHGEGIVYSNLCKASFALQEYATAWRYGEQAFLILNEVQDQYNTATLLETFMKIWAAQKHPRLAIFYGKQAVNLLQDIQGQNPDLEQRLRQSFLDSREDTYRILADLLITEGRFPEAEQVLNFLKQEEYADFTEQRATRGTGSPPTRLPLTELEQRQEEHLHNQSGRWSALRRELTELEAKTERSEEETQRVAQIVAELDKAEAAFQQGLGQVKQELAAARQEAVRIGFLDSIITPPYLSAFEPGTVVLYTLMGQKTYRIGLVSPEGRVWREHPIGAAKLSRMIFAFCRMVQNKQTPLYEIKKHAGELYDIVLGPVSADLKALQAKTLLWSLDGALRYLPLAALHDGEDYLVERYRNTVFTTTSLSWLKDRPHYPWTVLGLGVSKANGAFPALRWTRMELKAIVRETATDEGVLSGRLLMDEIFTLQAMRRELRRGPSVVHFAGHFALQPGRMTDSYMPLGDGTSLTLATINSWPHEFRGVDLAVLSGCNTANGGDAGGKEMDGLAEVVQRQGAKAVIASLWSIRDKSTSMLMPNFYQIRKDKPEISKAEALQEAQLEFLNGKIKPSNPGSDDPLSYSHPYYWAPFVLFGNGF